MTPHRSSGPRRSRRAALDDPEELLEGDGSRVRSIRVEGQAEVLDEPDVRRLMVQALTLEGVNLSSGSGSVVIRSKIATGQPSASTALPNRPSRRGSRRSRKEEVVRLKREEQDIAGSQLVVIDEAGHQVHEEKPDAVNRAIVSFLDGIGW